MNRFILLAFAVHCSWATTTIADDYLLRLDAIGYIDAPASEKDPKETVLHSIEVVARPESAFHGKAHIGTQTLTLAGKLRPTDSGDFVVRIRYVCSTDTGVTVPTEDGGHQPLLDESSARTEVLVGVGHSVSVGGRLSKSSEAGKPDRKSTLRHILTLTKYEPTDD